jgi:hypothetical protein
LPPIGKISVVGIIPVGIIPVGRALFGPAVVFEATHTLKSRKIAS